MWVVALHAIAHRGLVNLSLDFGGVFICVASQTEPVRSGGDQLHPGDITVYTHFVATRAAGGNRGVNGLPFRLVAVALQALRRVRILLQRYRVNIRTHGYCQQNYSSES